jgi:hypothetical protein
LILGSGLAANAGVLASVLRSLGASGAADAVLAAWKSDARVWVHLAAVLLGFAVIVVAALPLPGARTRPGVYLSSALSDPLRDFFTRYRSAGGLILALICFYRIPDFVLSIMNPFYLDLGYSLVEIAEVRKIFGVWMTMLGVFAGGVAVARYGLMRSMVVGAFAGPVSNLVALCCDRPRQRRRRLRRHLPHRLHVESDIGRIHGYSVRAFFLALRNSRPAPRLAIRPHRRGRGATCRFGRCAVGYQGDGGELGAGQLRQSRGTIGGQSWRAGHRLHRVLCVFRAHRHFRPGVGLRRPAPAGALKRGTLIYSVVVEWP